MAGADKPSAVTLPIMLQPLYIPLVKKPVRFEAFAHEVVLLREQQIKQAA